VDSEC
jgi:hypothetical protein